ncbi:AAA family ATPase [Niallia circulans]|uniref:AAA family ATPase n=2 Tax=Niallia circulans TaxID=1397 RepID=A0A553SUN5_NIACI|nr:AAA family ATPase [Niallia circulans]
MNNIECISILDYLEAYGGQAYESPERVDESKRQHYLDIKAAGSSAVKELDKMAELCAGRFGLIKSRPSKWLTGGNNKVRNYLWMQLKLASYESSPTSLSLFAEIVNGQVRFKFSVELNETKITKEDYHNHHRFLNRDKSTATDKLIYILGGNQKEDEMRDLSDSTLEARQRVEDGKYKKIQLARLITKYDIESIYHDNAGIINGMFKSIDALMPFYKLSVGENNAGPLESFSDNYGDNKSMKYTNKNMILYGPPGTGKTYNTVTYAVSIIENQSLENIQDEDYASVFERYNRYKDQGRIAFTTFHQSYGYEEFIEGIKPVISKQVEDEKTDIQYEYASGIFKRFCEKANNTINQSEKNGQNNNKPYVFIIDEINRGNISKIFGELITLIEPTKRLGEEEATTVILPYTGDEFGVPNNIYILGTMNTADSSIALMDTALRRRFQFIEMMPDENVLTKLNIQEIEGINIQKMLKTINERIEYLYDREHTIGHAYFTSLANDPTIDKLAEIFLNAIIPLLQEYFYEDYSKIQLVLGDNAKVDASIKFILDTDIKVREVFKGNPDIDLPEKKYSIQTDAFYKDESYKLIY